MELLTCRLLIVSHASIKQINRAVYKGLRNRLGDVKLVVPASLTLASGTIVYAEPRLEDDVDVVPLMLSGQNPRTYYYPELSNLLKQTKPTVVLLENDAVSRLGMQLSMWCRSNGSKLICQTYENLERGFGHTIKTQGWRGLIKNLPISLLNYVMAKRVEALLVVNSESERIFLRYGYSRVVKMPLGYDPAVFFPDATRKQQYRNQLNIDNSVTLIAYFGRLVHQKGVHHLIQALANLKTMNWRLLLDHFHDSENTYAASIRDSIRLHGLEDRVHYFEADHFEIANYMRAADIMAAPSITTTFFKEQYGRAVQEAMACGCVPVVSDSGHLKDIVGEESLVFREGNIAQLSEIITGLIGDNARIKNLSGMLQRRATEKLTIFAQAERLLDLLKSLNRD